MTSGRQRDNATERDGPYKRLTQGFLDLVDPYQASDEAPKQHTWPYVKSHMAAMRWVVVASVVVTALAAAVEVWLIRYAGQIVDMLAATPPDDFWDAKGSEMLVAALVVLLLRPFIQFLRLAINDITLQGNVAILVRWRAFRHLIKQSVGWFQDDLTGRTASRFVDIGNHVSDAIHSSLNAVAFGLVYMVGVAWLMADVSLLLALPLLVWLLLYIGVLVWVIPRMVDAHHAFQASKSALIGSVVDTFGNYETLKLFAPENQMAVEHRTHLADVRQSLFRTRQIGVGLRSSLVMLEAVVMVGFIGYGIWLWSTGVASIGVVAAAIALSLRVTTMADWILDSVWWVFMRVGSTREALTTVAQPIAIPQQADAPELVVTEGRITIRDLSHHYGRDRGGLRGVSLTIEPGEKVGIVGRSGAGKSTLVNLILRFFEAEHGRITIDAQDISGVNQDSLRAAIGMVSQQTSLLNQSVKDNILLGRTDVSGSELVAATTQAHAHTFIQDLLDARGRAGYDANVGERGVKLSGGQRQRIALARVILKDAPILILDEATSALDSEVEAEIQESLIGVMEDKTVIAIAHRLSTLAHMDRIVVLEDGEVAEEGTHQALLERTGLYARFWKRQSGGFIDTTV